MIKNKHINTKMRHSKGLTLIEILVALALLAVLLAFATPSIDGLAARADSKVAAENISHAFRMAKNTARITSKPVTLTFATGSAGNAITFDFPGETDVQANGIRMPDLDLSDDLSIIAKPAAFTFDPMGMIVGYDEASAIVLTSTADASHVTTVNITNAMGYVVVAGETSTEDESGSS